MNTQEIEKSIESKVIAIREGSALYTADEQNQNLVDEACAILDVNPEHLTNISEDDEDYDESEALEEIARAYEDKLSAAGYTVIWNDGFVIYKDLTDEEVEYVSNF